MVFTASLLGAQYKRDSVENKPASLFVVFLDKALNGMPPSLCGRQVVGPSSLPSWWPSLTEDSQIVRFLYVLFSHVFFYENFHPLRYLHDALQCMWLCEHPILSAKHSTCRTYTFMWTNP